MNEAQVRSIGGITGLVALQKRVGVRLLPFFKRVGHHAVVQSVS